MSENKKQAVYRQNGILDATSPAGSMGKITITPKGYEFIIGDKEACIAELEHRQELVVDFLTHTSRLGEREFVVKKVVDIFKGRDKATNHEELINE